jgi:hypothetical protein
MKTSGIELGVYETNEELAGRKATRDELISEIRQFSVDSVIWVCAVIANGIQVWDRSDPPFQIYADLIRLFFPHSIAGRFIANYYSRNPKREIFHRRQILLIAKLAIENCGNGGVDLRRQSQLFGSILLKTNDQFHYDLMRSTGGRMETRDDFARVIAEFIAVSEYAKPRLEYQIVRSHLLLTKYTQASSEHADFFNASEHFKFETGISLEEWESLLFVTHARYGRDSALEAKYNPMSLPLTIADYAATSVSYEKIDAFLREVSTAPASMRGSIRKSHSPNEFTPFRVHPLLSQWFGVGTKDQTVRYLLLDNHFLIEKQLSGPYWKAMRKNPAGFPRLWGSIFERYVNDFLANSCAGTKARFIPDLRHPKNANVQICDGVVIADDGIVLIEYKASIFTASAKYSGEHQVLAREIESKLVFAKNDDNKKAVAQLAKAVKVLLEDEAVIESLGIKKLPVTIYPLVVTLDGIGGTFGISSFLNLAFEAELRKLSIGPYKTSPLRCIDCAGMEYMAEFFHAKTMPELIRSWNHCSNSGAMPFVGTPMDDVEARPSKWLHAAYDDIFKSMVRVLFPDHDPEKALQDAQRKRPTSRTDLE